MTALARRTPPSSGQLLHRVLDQPGLIEAVRHLPAPALARLIDHVGLEDAGELIALATPAQLLDVFDLDLWRGARPGEVETLDAARFGVWLEVLLEAGAAAAAAKLAELPEDLLTHLVHQRALVLDLDRLERELAELGDDADLIDKLLGDRPYLELDGYRVVARVADGWDALATVLAELDQRHHHLCAAVLERCAHLARHDADDDGGLIEALSAEASLADDVAGDRDDRRAADGYVEPRAAAGFLRLAARDDGAAVRRNGRDATTRAYFRELAPRAPAASAAADALVALLADAGVLDDAPAARRRLASGAGGPAAALRTAVATLDEPVAAQRRAELVYLANVLVAGAALDGRPLRRAEAATAAVGACAVGLAHLVATTGEAAEAIVARDGADLLFRIGWHALARRGDPVRAALAAG